MTASTPKTPQRYTMLQQLLGVVLLRRRTFAAKYPAQSAPQIHDAMA
jgi:hypothetical protein